MVQTVLFHWSGSPGVYAPRSLAGEVVEERTSKRGVRQLLVKSPELNLPKWVPAADALAVAPALPRNAKAAVAAEASTAA